jgi:predicted TIM-barrel fold metal-dependent hydrolase
VKGFKFHPTVQGFYPQDKMAYHLYEVIAEYQLPMLFHSDILDLEVGYVVVADFG